MRFVLRVAYDGACFAGWQRQKSGIAAQQILEEALVRIFGQRVIAYGASRTDAGVHALGQCAHFDTPVASRHFAREEMLTALNANLPESLRVLTVRTSDENFHAQFSAKAKTYCYRIFNRRILCPLAAGRCWHVILPLDISAMQSAAQFFVGKKDFAVLGVSSKTKRESTVRCIESCEVISRGDFVWVRIKGDSFLYRMVRSMVGTLVSVGLGKAPPNWVKEVLNSQLRDPRQVTAPAEGLCLMAVHYDAWLCGEKKLCWQ